MKKFGRAFLVSVIASSLVVSSVLGAPSVNDLKKGKQSAEKEVKSLEKQLSDVMIKINNMEAKLIETGQDILETTEELEKAEEKEKKQYEGMKKRIKVLYENGNTVMLTKIFESGTLTEMLKQAENVQALHNYDRKQLEEYIKTTEKIAKMKDDLESDMQKLKSEQAEFEKEKHDLNATIAEQKAKVKDFDKKIQKAAEEAAREAAAREAAKKPSRPSGGNGGNYVPPANGQGGSAIVSAAYSYLGRPYVWGATGPNSFDCSGLVKRCHNDAGYYNIDRTSGAQGSGGKNIGTDISKALPGDVIHYSGHVAIYIGGGKVIHAPTTGDVVKIANWKSAGSGFDGIRRYW